MTESVIVVENLTRRFGEFVAVDHINFEVKPGEVIGYLGPNGSGKTTTIRMLLGLLKPSDGKATVLGYDVFKQSEEIRARVGYMSTGSTTRRASNIPLSWSVLKGMRTR